MHIKWRLWPLGNLSKIALLDFQTQIRKEEIILEEHLGKNEQELQNDDHYSMVKSKWSIWQINSFIINKRHRL